MQDFDVIQSCVFYVFIFYYFFKYNLFVDEKYYFSDYLF